MLTKSISLLLSSAFSVKYFSNKSKNKQVLSKIDNTQCDLYAWGNGIYGQLGLGAEKISQPIPDIVKSLNSVKIKQIYANYDTSCILTDDNTLYVWGKTKEGSIGLFPGGLSNNIVLPTVFPFSHQIQGKIAHVSLSKEHSAMVNDEGQIFTWGKDSFGCLGHANKENKKRGGLNISSILCDVVSSGEVKNVRCKQVACGYNYTVNYSIN
jgi:alpha-tubulin suppressor-like RCC1 family protein